MEVRMKKLVLFFSLGLVVSIALSSCNLFDNQTPTSQVDDLSTLVVQTINAQQTNVAQTGQPTNQGAQATPTPTPEPTEEPVVPSATPVPTNTPIVEPTQTSNLACNQAILISETISDGTDFGPNEKFTKTWTVKNTGTCTWDADYDVVFVKGDTLSAPASISLTKGTVKPGETIKIALELTAPITPGRHRGDFKLRDQNGNLFGIGEGNSNFWVEIDVKSTVYDFTENYCSSGVVWRHASGTLPCPGKSGDSDGWVKKINNPILENGSVDNEPGLQVHPQMVEKGWIRGTFPEMTVSKGVNFYAIIGCYDASKCDVRFRLNYKIDGGEEQTLAKWYEVQDGKFTRVKINLDELAGKNVSFILVTNANGSPENDLAMWFGPRIEP
jgi:hypothetical protein